jgi:hypothetical protein
MREFFKHPITASVFIIMGLVIAGIIFFKTCTHEVIHKGVVISHHTTSDRSGNIEYYTVATFDDGYLRSIHGLEYYIVEVGGTIYYTQTELKK